MPPKGYVSVTIKKEVYERLKNLRVSLGFGSINNLLAFLVEFYTSNVDRGKEINEIIEILKKCLEQSSRDAKGG